MQRLKKQNIYINYIMSSLTIVIYVVLLVLIFLLLKNVFNLNILSIVIIIFIIVVIFMYLFSGSSNTLQDLQNGETQSKIDATSLASNGTNVPATNFAYSIWFYVNDFNYRYGETKVIFGRMDAPTTNGQGSVDGVNGVNPCPLVVLGAVENNIETSLTCYADSSVTSDTTSGTTTTNTIIAPPCVIPNVPIQKWVNLIISVYGRTLDTYIDGKLVRTCLLPGIAYVNNDSPVYVTPSGGFNGWTSKFQYYPNPLNPQEAYNIYAAGYGNSSMSNSYQLQISLIENGTTQSSTTI
jgi:hypothetical protein